MVRLFKGNLTEKDYDKVVNPYNKGLTKEEEKERLILLDLSNDRRRWFTQEENERLQYLNTKKRYNMNTYLEDKQRATGRSTRLIDNYIQELFIMGKIRVLDHVDKKDLHRRLFDRVLQRLEIEHNFKTLIEEGKVKLFKTTYTIELIK